MVFCPLYWEGGAGFFWGGILVPQPGIEPVSLALGTWSINHCLLLKSPPDSSTLQFWESMHSSSFCSHFTLNSETHDSNWACLPEVISVSFFTSLCVHLSDLTQALCCLRILSWVYFSWVRWTSFVLCCTNHILLLLFVNICIAFTIFQALCE